MTRMNGGSQFSQNARAREFEVPALLPARPRLRIVDLGRCGAHRCGRFLLRLDGFTFPPSSHTLILPRNGPEITVMPEGRLCYTPPSITTSHRRSL